MSPLTDVLQDAAKRYLDSFPTAEERRRFIETARLSLAYNDAFKSSMPDRRRRALTTGPIDTDAQEQELVRWLCLVTAALTKQVQDHPTATGSIPAPLRRQVQFVSLIWKGFDPDIRKDELTAIERDLHNLYNAATAAETSEQNKINRQKVGDDAEDVRLQKLVVGILSSLKNKELSQNDRARYVLQKLGPRYRTGPRGQTWTPNALIKWARKRRIAI